MANRMAQQLVDEPLLAEGKNLLDKNKATHTELLEYRERLVKQIELVDDYLVDIATSIQKAVAGDVVAPVAPVRAAAGAPRPKGGKREPNKMRNGKVTDTWRIWEVLNQHGGKMTRAQLIPITDKMNIRNPESALYSLRESGHIKREGGFILVVA